ncbi:MAG TPA: hydantoinase/oxoprolinase family protein, partial [Dongiaceae bacterium]|nr:hydantoinase/oxoprolinase family protein [Dongiaceae bacterium]
MSTVLGIDTGGTFTDFVLVDEAQGAVTTAKVPSTPGDPAAAIAAGLARLEGVERVERLVIGTTVATNAVLQRRGPTILYVTNRGFEDVPFIARMDKARIYDLHWQKPKPLVRRRHCFGIGGRFDTHGREIVPLEAGELEELARKAAALAGEEVAVAICCLFAYLDGKHEQAAAAAVRKALPQAHISLSHEVSPLWREYERASTTIADAFIKPVVSRYVQGVGRVIEEKLSARRWNLLASNGGYLRADQAERRPAQLLVSGLAGGVIGGRYYADLAGAKRAFTLDIGGTSTDIGLVLEGGQQYAAEFDIDFGIPVTIPCVAVRTIGAGGGSIAWIDKGGLLHVGPQSAGAEPGPVAYGRGGIEPTVTDANLVLGRLDPDFFLGGAMSLDLEAARRALTKLGEALSLSAEQTALAVIRTVDENMANAIRLIAVERGLDTRDFALIAFGGAGPLHARAVAERLGIATVIVPPHPGLCSAFGAAIAEARVDRVQTLFTRSDNADIPVVAEALKRLKAGAVEELRRSVEAAAPEIRASADMRYAGQNYELEVAMPEGEMNAAAWEALMTRFGEAHERQYGFALPGEPVELINLRVTALRPEPPRDFTDLSRGSARPERRRAVWFDSGPIEDCRIRHRAGLAAGDPVTGPAV